METVMDVVVANPDASIVLVERHASYLMGPLLARCPDEYEAYARNYSEREHPSLFLLDKAGIELAWKQGRRLAQAGVNVDEIIGSEQGRGPDTGLRISEGHFMETGQWIPVRIHPAVNYMKYDYDKLLPLLRTVGDPFAAQWMNGQHEGLARSDTPGSFKGRVLGFLDDLLKKSGVCIITTHFEIVALVRNIKVEGRDLGTIREDWTPKKGGGILLVRSPDGRNTAFDYMPDFTIGGVSRDTTLWW